MEGRLSKSEKPNGKEYLGSAEGEKGSPEPVSLDLFRFSAPEDRNASPSFGICAREGHADEQIEEEIIGGNWSP